MIKRIFTISILVTTLVSARISDIKTISADFTQKVTNETNQVLLYKGTMFAKKKNNQALWIYTYPFEKEIYYKNGKIVVIEPDLEQATFAKLNKVPNILTLLKRAKKISHNRLVTRFNGTKYYITLYHNKISQIDYIDEMQNRVSIKLSAVKINKPISDRRFIYHIPKDYDILQAQ